MRAATLLLVKLVPTTKADCENLLDEVANPADGTESMGTAKDPFLTLDAVAVTLLTNAGLF